jgi:polysaccharide export outer membrane protein
MTRWSSRSFPHVIRAFLAAALLMSFGAAWAQTGVTRPPATQTVQPTAPLSTPTQPSAGPTTPAQTTPAQAAPAQAVPGQTTPAQSAATQGGPSSADGYVLGVNDRVRVLVFGEQSLSGEFLVDSTGRLAMPFIGEVQAAGLTRQMLEDLLEKKLADQEILLDPRVSVDFLNFRPYYILGEVGKPGEYPYTAGLNVFNAVATAGGFSALANQTRVMIKRQGEQTETEYSLLSPVTVQPGDTIRVIKGAFYILGEVTRPGEYPFSEGLTVQNAVATAGGFTYRANQRQIYIKRRNETTERRVRMNASLPVEPGDTIRITERFF